MNLDAAVETFIAESAELLESIETNLLELENDGADQELLNALFRAIHTIKGSAGLFGFDEVVAFTHEVESALDRVRSGELALSADLCALLLRCRDHIRSLVEPDCLGQALVATVAAHGQALLAELAAVTRGGAAPSAGSLQSAVTRPSSVICDTATPVAGAWHISLRFGSEVLRNGMDPHSFLRYLESLGRITALTTLVDRMPTLDDIDPEACYLGFELQLDAAVDQGTIEAAFEFVREDCTLHIVAPHGGVEDYLRLIDALSHDEPRIGEILFKCGALSEEAMQASLRKQAATEVDPRQNPQKLGEILVATGEVDATVVSAALDKQRQIKEQSSRDGCLVRVDARKLDALVDLVGELVISSASSQLTARRHGHADMLEATALTTRLIEEMRDTVLSLRMVEIGATLHRFQRIVRDVSRELGKDIRLEVVGGDTELDKSLVEKIADPLMHLVRNAMDHGIEASAQRVAAGKPAQGRLLLNAFHESGSIVIEVSDDGGGLRRDSIVRKALDRGLIHEGQTLSDSEIFNLIFEPGFSTAASVSNLSGRGVGMDVVRRSVQALRGSIEIDSQAGSGTTFRIRLPLTLAIIDGFLFGVGSSRYVLPVDHIAECLELSREDERDIRQRGFVDLRGSCLPVLWLRDLFGHKHSSGAARQNIVVVRDGTLHLGLIVDELLGEAQTVIKPLGALFRALQGISGTAILGSGEVALILDVQGLVAAKARQGNAHHTPPLAMAS